MAVLAAMGLLGPEQTFTHESIVGSLFRGRMVGETTVGELPAIVPEIEGEAVITGEHTFILDPGDPFQLEGYWSMLVGQRVPHDAPHAATATEQAAWRQYQQTHLAAARAGYGVAEALALVRSPQWQWPLALYPKLCNPAPSAANSVAAPTPTPLATPAVTPAPQLQPARG
jgi:hypothetical protein